MRDIYQAGKYTDCDRTSQVGQRSTVQRDVILEVLTAARGPLSIPEIHQRSQKAHSGIGLSTVYRTLKLLQQSGYIVGIILSSGRPRFELTKGRHEHFQCRKCQEVFTLSLRSLALPDNSILEGGFLVEDHELTFYGTCPLCLPADEMENH